MIKNLITKGLRLKILGMSKLHRTITLIINIKQEVHEKI